MQHWPAAVSDEFSFGRSGVRQSAGGGLEPTQPCGKCHAERSPGISQFFWEYTNELTFSNIQHPTSNAQRSMKPLPAEGLEPTRPCGHWILSPARLPIPPRRLFTQKRCFYLCKTAFFVQLLF